MHNKKCIWWNVKENNIGKCILQCLLGVSIQNLAPAADVYNSGGYDT